MRDVDRACFVLGVVFVALKLTGHVGWSWAWVTLPIWGYTALWLLVYLVMRLLLFLSGCDASGYLRPKWKRW